ncbi:MAG: NAD(P)H-dependent oxidoreductase [Planctomycetaceae bacterium]|nr:NAD(P)H-dependent oxidoreductase [Planctomycetaceae bacterium]
MAKTVIGVVVGSARTGSFTKIVADTIVELMPDSFDMRHIQIADLPLYNQDYDDGATPERYDSYRKEIASMNGFLFVTPEHNRSIPALLKNALDIASRPSGENKWSGKPGGLVSVSPGGIGGFGANHITRQSLSFLNVYMMQQPEAYVGNVTAMINEEGKIVEERGRQFLKKVADEFAAWVHRFR